MCTLLDSSKREERGVGGHALANIYAQVGDLVMDVREGVKASPLTGLHDFDHVAAVQLHCHLSSGPKGLRSDVLCPDSLAAETQSADGSSHMSASS